MWFATYAVVPVLLKVTSIPPALPFVGSTEPAGSTMTVCEPSVAGPTMTPRDRDMQSLDKYKTPYSPDEDTEALRSKLAQFYAQRTLTKQPILPRDCANAIVWLLSEQSGKTTGHIIPVDGGLTEAFLR